MSMVDIEANWFIMLIGLGAFICSKYFLVRFVDGEQPSMVVILPHHPLMASQVMKSASKGEKQKVWQEVEIDVYL